MDNENTLRPIHPEDRSYRDVMMLFSDQPVKPKYWFKDFGDYWSCSCGQINRGDICSNCGIERELLRQLFDGDMPDSSAAACGTDPADPVETDAETESVPYDDSYRFEADEDSDSEAVAYESDGAEDHDPPDSSGEFTDYQRRRRRTGKVMILLLVLILLLGGGLAVFYFYGLPEIKRQNDIQTNAAKNSLIESLPGALSAYDDSAVSFDINRSVGDHYYEKKNYEKAIEYYNKALDSKSDESLRRKVDAAKYNYVSTHRKEGGALFETYLDELYKAKHSGIQHIYDSYYEWEASIVTNTGAKDYTTDMSTINRANTIYFHTTFSGGPPDEKLDLYYEIVWPDGSKQKRAISSTKSSGETVTTNCTYTYPAKPGEGKLIYRIFSNSNHKQLATDSVTLQ